MAHETLEPFISIDDLAAYLRRDLTADVLAEMAIGSACETLRDMIGQDLAGVIDDIVIMDGTGTDTLLLPQVPVHDVTSVKLNGRVIPDTTYYLDKRDGALYRKSTFWPSFGGLFSMLWLQGRGVYEVTYSHGWNAADASGSGGVADLPPIPRTLKILATTMAARIYDQGLVSQENVGTYRVIYSAESSLSLTKGEMAIIAKYRARSAM